MDEQTLERGLAGLDSQIKTFVSKHQNQTNEFANRLLALEQKGASVLCGPSGSETKSLGDVIAESDGFKALCEGKVKSSGSIRIGSFHKTAIVNSTAGSPAGTAQPLVAGQRFGCVVTLAVPRLTVRDLLPQYRTNSNLVEFARETSVTNNAAPVTGGSPNDNENVAKAESAIAYELATAPVKTLAHFIPASRQVMEDSTAFASYINDRMLFLLKQAELRTLQKLGYRVELSGNPA